MLLLGGCSNNFSEKIKNLIPKEDEKKEEEETNHLEETKEVHNVERELSAEELREFTDWVNQKENNGFLLSEYTKPEEVNLNEVFYNGAGIEEEPLSKEEEKAYVSKVGAIETDITKLTSAQIEEFLQKKMGISFQEVENSLDWLYLEEFDSYISQHGDTNQTVFFCTDGSQLEDNYFELHCRSENDYIHSILTLKKAEDSYLIVSNQYETKTESNEQLQPVERIEEQCFTINLNGFGEVQFVSYAPRTREGSFQDVIFELQKNQAVIYTFPGIEEGYTRSNKIFAQVDAVAFVDYDKDGYQDVIAICSYLQEEDGENAVLSPEVRIYKGTEYDFQYLSQVSLALNSEGYNKEIAQVREKIELAQVDISALEENVRKQLEVFAETRQEWLFYEMGPSVCGYAVCDLNQDGILELVAQTTQGTGMYSENHFYQMNSTGDGIVEIPQEYYSNEAELDIGISSISSFAYKDKVTGVIYYPANDITKNGYAETLQAEGVYYLKDNCVYSLIYRMKHILANNDGIIEETYYDAEGNEINKETWEQLLEDFFQEKEAWKSTIDWTNMYPEDYEAASYQEILRILVENYTLNQR